jgi:hypothetical protein
MRRCTLHGRKNILKRLLIHVGAFNISLVLRKMLGAGKPRELKNRGASLVSRVIQCLISLYPPESAAKPSPHAAHPHLDRSRMIKVRYMPSWKMASCTTGC